MASEAPSSRDKILDVAEELFARRGFSGVGMSEVADAVGLRKSSLFHHFRSKSQLYFEVQGRVLRRIRERLDPVVKLTADPMEKLDRLIDAGHTVIVVEHHLELIRSADWILDLGPGAGDDGGTIVFEGPPADARNAPTETGRYLATHL